MKLKPIRTNLLAAAAILVLVFAQPIARSAYADEMADRNEINQNVRQLFVDQNFAELERIATSYLASRARTSSGLWKIGLYDGGIIDLFHCPCTNEEFWNHAEDNVKRWIAQYPNSINAHLAYAHMLLERGWSIRGWGYVNTVDPANWKPFLEYVEKTRTYLMKHEKIGISDPRWNDMIVDIANLQQISETDYAALANTALDRHPDYYPTYFDIMTHYEPKWGGSAAAIEKFARESAARDRSKEGEGMYARIYWYAAQKLYGNNLFRSSSVDWSEMKRGIDDVLKAFPDQWNINNFAKFACIANDKEKTKELISLISGDPVLEAWVDRTIYEDCKTWATAK